MVRRRKLRGITFDSPDERAVFHAKESWVPVVLGGVPFILLGILGFVVSTVAFPIQPLIGIAVMTLCCVLALVTRIPHIIANWDTDVVITNRRLYARYGIIDIRDQVCDLKNISDVLVDPSILGRIFDYGDVRIQTYAGEQDFYFKKIAHPYDMRQAISLGSDNVGKEQPHKRPPRREFR